MDAAVVEGVFVFVMVAAVGLLAWAVGVAIIVTAMLVHWIAKNVNSRLHTKHSKPAEKHLWP